MHLCSLLDVYLAYNYDTYYISDFANVYTESVLCAYVKIREQISDS